MSSHLAKVHFSLRCYLWCLSDVCVCLAVVVVVKFYFNRIAVSTKSL